MRFRIFDTSKRGVIKKEVKDIEEAWRLLNEYKKNYDWCFNITTLGLQYFDYDTDDWMEWHDENWKDIWRHFEGKEK